MEQDPDELKEELDKNGVKEYSLDIFRFRVESRKEEDEKEEDQNEGIFSFHIEDDDKEDDEEEEIIIGDKSNPYSQQKKNRNQRGSEDRNKVKGEMESLWRNQINKSKSD